MRKSMIGVIIVPGSSPALCGLGEHRPAALLPLVDRPFLQHLIEFLILQEIRRFELLLEHKAEQVEAFLGDGARWGCQMRYHLIADAERPYESLQVIEHLREDAWILVHADRFPHVSLVPFREQSRPVVFFDDDMWTGAAVVPARFGIREIATKSKGELSRFWLQLAQSGDVQCARNVECVSMETPASLLRSQQQLLCGGIKQLMIQGRQQDAGVWKSRNVVVHPTARIVAPVYLGPNCRIAQGAQIGPHAAVSANCIIDAFTTVKNSLVTAGSYVGQKLELDGAIVDRNLLVNSKLQTGVVMKEAFLLGKLTDSRRRGPVRRLIESFFAAALLLLLFPILSLVLGWAVISRSARWSFITAIGLPAESDPASWIGYRLPVLDNGDPQGNVSAGWKSFLLRFLPGLLAVARGNLALVGLPPRSAEQILQLPDYWRSLYLAGEAGLITEASLLALTDAAQTEMYLAEAYYCAQRGWAHHLKLVAQYLGCLIRPFAKRFCVK